MSGNNIFSALAKYGSTAEENYLTEAFVFLLNSLLERERTVALSILDQLCVNNNEFCFDKDEDISVSTQDVTEQGTPDIKVSSPDKLIYIEVKHDSLLGYQQIERYKKALEISSATIKQVILLTRYSVDFEKPESRPYKHIYWRNVHKWLENTHAQDSVIAYFLDSFKSFLEVKQMAIQKVGWEYINGVPALNNLISMVEEAIQNASLHIDKKSPGWEFKGFYLENKEFWCGIVYPDHLLVIFEIQAKKSALKLVDKSSYLWRESGAGLIQCCLNLEDKFFFSLDKDKQLGEITKFVKTAYAEARKMRIKSKPTRQSRKPK